MTLNSWPSMNDFRWTTLHWRVSIDDSRWMTLDGRVSMDDPRRVTLDVRRLGRAIWNTRSCLLVFSTLRPDSSVMSCRPRKYGWKTKDAVKAWPEPNSVQDLQVFIGFADFYRHLIQGFSRIATLHTPRCFSAHQLKSSRVWLPMRLMMVVDRSKIWLSLEPSKNCQKSEFSPKPKTIGWPEESSFPTPETKPVLLGR